MSLRQQSQGNTVCCAKRPGQIQKLVSFIMCRWSDFPQKVIGTVTVMLQLRKCFVVTFGLANGFSSTSLVPIPTPYWVLHEFQIAWKKHALFWVYFPCKINVFGDKHSTFSVLNQTFVEMTKVKHLIST